MARQRVLFVCVHNSARSQIAEAWINHLCPDFFEAQSAGLEPGVLNSLAVQVMHEVGIDISMKQTQSVFDLYRSGSRFAYIITVCDEAGAERCPVFPGVAKRYQWNFPDPAAFGGTPEDKLVQVRVVRDAIKSKIAELCSEVCASDA